MNQTLNVKECVAGNVTFVKYLGGNLYYKTSNGVEFAVPIEDIGNATFLAEDKGMFFMRWIRKHIELVNKKESKDESLEQAPAGN